MINGKHWFAFFSHTGTEIANISKRLGIVPDCIITNNEPGNKNINKTTLKLKSEICIYLLSHTFCSTPFIIFYIKSMPTFMFDMLSFRTIISWNVPITGHSCLITWPGGSKVIDSP